MGKNWHETNPDPCFFGVRECLIYYLELCSNRKCFKIKGLLIQNTSALPINLAVEREGERMMSANGFRVT